MRVGILGGTFDPPHIGHLILGEYAADALGLARLLYIPAADPPHKQHEKKTPVEHRLAMLRLALVDNPRFELSRVDLDRAGPHYSLDTVRIVRQQYPQAEIYFVMGGDSLRDLPEWHRPTEFIQLCKLAVMSRPGAEVSPDMHEAVLPGLAQRVVMIAAPQIEISSTDIAQRLSEGRSVRYLLPDSVRAYVQQNHLYATT
ncbi:MAG: nicotinate-nucleotide adenylyltransferase [Anaerolineae bacterium]|nr:nicotinate-nucleotide adenylyltransferase [Anaerolineae bacterium]